MKLRIFAITKPGLIALALSVGVLWACVAVEAATRERAGRDAVTSIETLAHLRRLVRNPNPQAPVRETTPVFRPARTAAS